MFICLFLCEFSIPRVAHATKKGVNPIFFPNLRKYVNFFYITPNQVYTFTTLKILKKFLRLDLPSLDYTCTHYLFNSCKIICFTSVIYNSFTEKANNKKTPPSLVIIIPCIDQLILQNTLILGYFRRLRKSLVDFYIN